MTPGHRRQHPGRSEQGIGRMRVSARPAGAGWGWRGAMAILLLAAAGCGPAGPPGPRAPFPPVQTDRLPEDVPFQAGDYRIIPLARFTITAQVLSRARYYFGREADLSPVDLVLGWGAMSDRAVLAQLEIFQYGRRYRRRAAGDLPVPREQIERGSANMHLLPADAALARRVCALRRHNLVRLTGWLVRVEASDGWRWSSSLTRDDTGSGACEVLWVRSCERLK